MFPSPSCTHVIPLTTSGLHCGVFSTVIRRSGCVVIPLTTSGLHCGPVACWYSANWASGHPAHHERAPLRRSPQIRLRPAISRHPAHHERAPLRQIARAFMSRLRAGVIPLTTSGLHCGLVASVSTSCGQSVIPLTTSGLHCGGFRVVPVDAHHMVIPLTTSGLHCGAVFANGELVIDGSSRSPRAGSIAAASRRVTQIPPLRHPAHHERAPLRLRRPVDLHVPRDPSSRSPRAGSIAAFTNPDRRPPVNMSSRSPRAGSIAARAPSRRGPSAPVSSRSPRAGSIAAGCRRTGCQ